MSASAKSLLESVRAQLSVAIADHIGLPLRAVESAVAEVTADWSVELRWEQNTARYSIQAPAPLGGPAMSACENFWVGEVSGQRETCGQLADQSVLDVTGSVINVCPQCAEEIRGDVRMIRRAQQPGEQVQR